jgi:hypothetical protein
MKATTIIIAAVLSLQFNFLFADNPDNNVSNNASVNEIANLRMIDLTPVTPSEAGFSDVIPEPLVNVTKLAPVTPAEADFNDNAPEMKVNTIDLAPETPSVADFEETDADQPDNNLLIPVTPKEADFE